MEIEETINGNYQSVYGEVVTNDIYDIKSLPFIVDTVLDLGANVGIFSRFVAKKFPEAKIIAIEPDQKNCNEFIRFTNDENIILIEAAIGIGKIYRVKNADNGARESYLSISAGYDEKDLNIFDKTEIKSIRLNDIEIKGKSILKIDIEGNETVIFNDKKMMNALKQYDYIIGELHYFAAHGGKLPAVKRITKKALKDLSKTHNVQVDGVIFNALKKEYKKNTMIKHRIHLNRLMPRRKLTGVEVGVASGLFSNDMLMNWKIETLYLVDVWKCIPTQKGDGSSPQPWHDFNFESMRRLMANHNKKAIIMQGFSVHMARKIKDESLDFVYFDGDHSYKGVMSDLMAWFPKVKPGGLVAGHDYLNEAYGVNQAVKEFCFNQTPVLAPLIIPEHKEEDAGFYFIKT